MESNNALEGITCTHQEARASKEGKGDVKLVTIWGQEILLPSKLNEPNTYNLVIMMRARATDGGGGDEATKIIKSERYR